LRGFGHVFGGRNLTFRTNNYSLFFALRFGDLRDGSFQTFRQDNIFQLDALVVDAPWIGGGINCLFDALANFLLVRKEDRKSTRLNSSHSSISYAGFCLKKKYI